MNVLKFFARDKARARDAALRAHGITQSDVDRVNAAIERAAVGGPLPDVREVARVGEAYQRAMRDLEKRGLA